MNKITEELDKLLELQSQKNQMTSKLIELQRNFREKEDEYGKALHEFYSGLRTRLNTLGLEYAAQDVGISLNHKGKIITISLSGITSFDIPKELKV